MKRIVQLLALLLAAVCMLSTEGCRKTEEAGAITASGTIEATEVNLASKVAGQVLVMPIEEGSTVKTGDVIASVDHASLDIQLREVEAAIASAEAQYRLLQKGARSEDIKQAEEALRQAEASKSLAVYDANHVGELAKTGAATGQQLENVQTRVRVAESQVASAKEMVAKVRQITRPEELQAAHARIEQAMATRDRVKKLIQDCEILSPVNGIVTHKVVEAGELVGTGATLATVSAMDRVHLMIYVTEQELPKIKLGETAKIHIDGMPNNTFEGKVIYISPEAEFTPKNIQTKDDRVKLVFGVKIEIMNPQGALKRGLPADATIITA